MSVLEEVVADYLRGQRATLWGRAFDLSQDESFDEASRFLIGVLVDVTTQYTERASGA